MSKEKKLRFTFNYFLMITLNINYSFGLNWCRKAREKMITHKMYVYVQIKFLSRRLRIYKNKMFSVKIECVS